MTPCKFLGQKFVHLHLHTEYSPMDAPVGLKRLVQYAKHLGYKSLAVTDHGTVGSWVKFAYLCKESQIKPIFGVEAYFTPDRHKKEGTQKNNHHLVMMAKNDQGIKSIYRMMEKAALEGFYFNPRVDWELLEQHHEGVVCTSACVSGIVPRAIREGNVAGAMEMASRFKGIFGPDYYVELQYHALDIEEKTYGPMSQLARDLGIKTVGTNDVHYLRPEDHGTQEALMALNTQACIRDPGRLKHEQRQFYMKSPDEMLQVFERGSQAAESTLEIMDSCTAQLEFGKTQLPSAEVPKEFPSEMEYLESLARAGLRDEGMEGDPVYEARFKEEFDVIKRLRARGLTFDRYFLVVWDYVNHARKNGIRVGVGRGSGCGSLVLFCLKITAIDPIEHDLMFERFLEESRNEMPDIDIDFDFEFQDKMFEYLEQKYGTANYARIGTNNVFQVASAIKAAFRVFDPMKTWEKEEASKAADKHAAKLAKTRGTPRETKKPKDETSLLADRITKLLPRNLAGGPDSKCTLSKEKFDKGKPGDHIYVYADPEFVDLRKRHTEIFEFAEALEGIVNARGVHAAGVILTAQPLVDTCPKHLVGSEEKKHKEACTVFDMADVDKLGLIKMDILATKALSAFTRTLKMVEERHGVRIDLDRLKPNDAKVFKGVFANANTLTVFQFESKGMRNVLREMKPDCFAHIVAANALFRPGPMDHIPSYIARRHGVEKVSFPAPSIAKVLQPTFGIMVYQEQVMRVCQVLAEFSASEADVVRKAMGKKKKDVLEKMHPKFLEGCERLKSCSAGVAKQIWGDMAVFAEYAFNKSHAVAYAFTAYQCAYLKHYYPVEYMASQMTVEGLDKKLDVVLEYEQGAREMGIRLLQVDINKSRADYAIETAAGKPAIRKGLCGVPKMGAAPREDIVKGQPYSDMFDFCMRAGAGVKSDLAYVLAEAGGFDSFLPKLSTKIGRQASRKDLKAEYDSQANRAKAAKRVKDAAREERDGIPSMFGKKKFTLEV